MKTVSLVARILLGLVFTVFGLNGFLHFIPMGPMPTGPRVSSPVHSRHRITWLSSPVSNSGPECRSC